MAEFYQTGGNNTGGDFNPKKVVLIGGIVGAFILAIIFYKSISVTIPAGHAGVKYRTFGEGTVTEKTYSEGFHFMFPWNDMIIYEVREMVKEQSLNILSNDAARIEIDISINYNPIEEKLGYLHAEIGPNYHDRIVINKARDISRSVFGKYSPEEIYSSKKEVIQQQILEEIKKVANEKHIDIKSFQIRSIELPERLKVAIEMKLKQQQEAEQYKYKLEKARQEAERQRIEAEGKATANKIISASLTDKILQEKGIEATIKLSESPNAKVVVVGGGKDGLPLILGNN